MNRTLKKALSFVLALAMVVLATVPAFAATGTIEPNPTNNTKIKFMVTRGGNKENVMPTTNAGTIKNAGSKGEFYLEDGKTLKANMTYVLSMAAKDVEEGTPCEFAITTNSKGEISSIKAITKELKKGKEEIVDEKDLDKKDQNEFQFEFKLLNEKTPETYTIYTRDLAGKPIEEATSLRIYGVLNNGKEYIYGDNNAINQVDYNNHLGGVGVPAGKYNSDNTLVADSKFTLSEQSLELFKQYVSAPGLPIVALVEAGPDKQFDTEDDIVVFTDFSKDKQAVLTVPVLGQRYANLKVIVRGMKNPVVAVEGATVEIQKNSTKLFGPESFGEAIAKGKTNKHGEVVFDNVQVADLLKYLSDSNISGGQDYDNAFNEMELPFRAVVTAADGYAVPVGQVISRSIITNQKGEIVIDLLPTASANLVKRIAGDNRFDTSVEIAEKLYPQKADLGAKQTNLPANDPLKGKKTVILANGMIFPDALTANGLVKYYDAPILLTDGNKLTPSVEKFIKDYEVDGVIIIGGTNSVKGDLETKLQDAGITTTRLAGESRYGTSAAVAERIAMLNGDKLPAKNVDGSGQKIFQAFVASGENFADALVASVPAAIYGAPILLTAKNSVPAETKEVISKYKVSSAIVVGGENSITPDTFGNLNIATKERLSGENRQLTSMKIAEKFFPQAGSAFVAGAKVYPDALVGGALSAEKRAPILLTDSNALTPTVKDYIVKHRITDVVIIGGPNSVSATVAGQLESAVLEASK